ncbi:MAG: tetratricopeptide repeat protein [Treponema sp.]|nr:tetratricopeptide repeat protein [Treponema sp.]
MTNFSQSYIIAIMGTQSEEAIIKALSFIKDGKLELAKKELETAFLDDLESKALRVCTAFCCNWIKAFSESDSAADLTKGDNLLQMWNSFVPWTKKFACDFENDELYEDAMFAFKTCVYSRALQEYEKIPDDGDPKMKAELLRKTGLCEKRLGNYDNALNLLKEANSLNPGQAEIISEMADCLELCGDSKLARVLYREAFFVDPEKVCLENLDSPLIQELVSRITESKEYSGRILQEWLPVYGILLGAFNVKRPLKSQEVGRLKQNIYSKENELKASDHKDLIVPRLMNLYLWLMDYYLLSKESTVKINELLLKIKLLDSEIYEGYFK